MLFKQAVASLLEKEYGDQPPTKRPNALARFLEMNEMDVRRMLRAGRNQEKMFDVVRRLEPLFNKHKINWRKNGHK